MALASGDEEIAGEIAQYLDPEEVERQFKNVFGNDCSAFLFLRQQSNEAEVLFEDLVVAFNNATSVPHTTPVSLTLIESS